MAGGPALTYDEHVSRTAYHRQIGETLADVKHEWAAVPLFYAAYHVVKAAFLADPIFDDGQLCTAKHRFLTPGARDATGHHGRFRPIDPPEKVWGVNELVGLLYPAVGTIYEQMHLASVEVRYKRGLRVPLPNLRTSLQDIDARLHSGQLVAKVKPSG